MTTDPLAARPTAYCVSFPADDLDRIRAEAKHEAMDVEDWIRQVVWERLQVKHVERSDAAEMAAVKAVEAVKRRRED